MTAAGLYTQRRRSQADSEGAWEREAGVAPRQTLPQTTRLAPATRPDTRRHPTAPGRPGPPARGLATLSAAPERKDQP